jgi:arsenite-transporting ATPase
LRTLLLTGPGGAGRTSAAVATAASAAFPGFAVLLLTAADQGGRPVGEALRRAGLDPYGDPAAGVPLGPGLTARPVAAIPGLWLAEIDAEASFRAAAAGAQRGLGGLLGFLGAAPLDAEELTALPGAADLALLRALALARASGRWGLTVVDLPPTRAAVDLLALPERLRRYLARLLPPERQAARALRPVLAQLAGVPMPTEAVYAAAARADRQLADAEAVLAGTGTTVRLVVGPGTGAAAVRLARTGLALHGHAVDGVLANQPHLHAPGGPDPDGLAALQEDGGLPVYGVPWAPPGKPLAVLPAVPPGGRPPGERRADPWRIEDRLAADGCLAWLLPLPGADRDSLDLVRRGDELLLGAHGFRRIVALPAALRRCTVSGAGLRDGVLTVRFTPDPALWPAPPTDRPGPAGAPGSAPR